MDYAIICIIKCFEQIENGTGILKIKKIASQKEIDHETIFYPKLQHECGNFRESVIFVFNNRK